MNWRSPKLLKAAKDAPNCMGCGTANMGGNLVMAHSNQLRDGKGTGIKAHDFRVAILCHHCHMSLDAGGHWGREDKREFWEQAHRKTVAWMFLSGIVEVK